LPSRPPQHSAPEGGEPSDELRGRIVASITRVAAERGYASFSVDAVLRAAGISQETFDRYFAGPEQALIAAHEDFLERLTLDARGACRGADGWPGQVHAATAAVLASLIEASSLARALWVEGAGASLASAERQFVALEQFAAMLRDGRRHYPAAAALPEITERVLIGGVASVASGCLLAEEPEALTQLCPELVEVLLIPYLGNAEARRAVQA
jgi:AcrR family transcriptional regulator